MAPPLALFPILDPLALLVVFLSLPPPASCLVLLLHTFLGSLRAFANQTFLRLLNVPTPHTIMDTLLLQKVMAVGIFLFHAGVALLISYAFPVVQRLLRVVAHALVAAALMGESTVPTAIICSLMVYAAGMTAERFFNVSALGSDFSGLLHHPAYRSHITSYFSSHWDAHKVAAAIAQVSGFVLLALAVHTVSLAIAPVGNHVFLLKGYTRSLDQLATLAPDFPVARYRRRGGDTEGEVVLAASTSVVVPPSVAASTNWLSKSESQPAPLPSLTTLLLLSPVVCANFYNHSATNSTQPVWLTVALARAMLRHQDIYSGDSPHQWGLVGATAHTSHLMPLISAALAFVVYVGETSVGILLPRRTAESLLVKINGAMWYQVSEAAVAGGTAVIISGLTPLLQCDVELVDVDASGTGEHLATVIVSTVHKQTVVSQTSKPLVTLQESLRTTNDNLARERDRLRKTRKEIAKKLSVLKKEIEGLAGAPSGNAANDARSWRKLASLRATVSQIESESSELEKESSRVGEQEQEVSERHYAEKRGIEDELRVLKSVAATFDKEMAKLQAKLKSSETELAAVESKGEKLLAKIDKLVAEGDRITEEMEELKRKDIDNRKALRKERKAVRDRMLQQYVREIEEIKLRASAGA